MVAAFGGFLMGGDVIVGLIVFAILLVVNFMVVTKGSGRIAEVAARFSLMLGMLGSVRTKTLKAFPEAAYREIIASLG